MTINQIEIKTLHGDFYSAVHGLGRQYLSYRENVKM